MRRPHPAVSHFTNLVGATLAARRLRERSRGDRGLVRRGAGTRLGARRAALPLMFLFHSELYSEWVQARSVGRPLLRRYMAAIERRVFVEQRAHCRRQSVSARQIASRAPDAHQRVRVMPTGVDTATSCPSTSQSTKRSRRSASGPIVPIALGVGRLAGVKQFDRLITAFAAARAQGLAAGW